MTRRRIPLAELRRLELALERFEDQIEAAYPGYMRGGPEGDASQDMSETVRNALTALAHIRGWIVYRVRSRRDPFEEIDLG